MIRRPPRSTLFPYTDALPISDARLSRGSRDRAPECRRRAPARSGRRNRIWRGCARAPRDRKSTRLNSSHDQISYAVFCLKKKNKYTNKSNKQKKKKKKKNK